jgi:hypothetical protein
MNKNSKQKQKQNEIGKFKYHTNLNYTKPGACVIKLITAVIYLDSIVIP